MRTLSVLLFLAVGGFFAGCGPTGIQIPEDGVPHRKLSDYGLFVGQLAELKPAERVMPYDLNSPLFTDYAHKYRTVWVPQGKQIAYNDSTTLDFPVGAMISKTFYYPHDFRKPKAGRNLIETRILVKGEDRWHPYEYVWNEEQTDAELKVAGEIRNVSWTHYDGAQRSANYLVPNTNQCKGCHANKGIVRPIGPKARNLNGTYSYDDGERNQLIAWQQAGILTGAPAPEAAPRLAVWNDPGTGSLDKRARAWLEINCAHCHNPNGPAGTSGLDLMASQQDPAKWGICKAPVAAGRGSGGRGYDIVPGHAEASILWFRIQSEDPGEMMPELARSIKHDEGIALVREWIDKMEPRVCDKKKPLDT